MGARVKPVHPALASVAHALAKNCKMDEFAVTQRGPERGQRHEGSLVLEGGLLYATTFHRMSVQPATEELASLPDGRINTLTLEHMGALTGTPRSAFVAEKVKGKSYTRRIWTTRRELRAMLATLKRESGQSMGKSLLQLNFYGGVLEAYQAVGADPNIGRPAGALGYIARTTMTPTRSEGKDVGVKTLLTAKWFQSAVDAMPDGEVELMLSGSCDPVVLRSVGEPDRVDLFMPRYL